MKDYKTFLSEQVELNEKVKTSQSVTVAGVGSDKKDTIASTTGLTVKVDGIDKVSFIKSLTDRTIYNFDSLISGFEALSTYTIRPEEKAVFKRTLEQMRNDDPRKEGLVRELENISALPHSSDKMMRTQNVLSTLNNIALEMGEGSLSSKQLRPELFIPNQTRRTFDGRG